MLARKGKSVVVLDDGPIASGQTQRTTAHLSNAIDDRYFELEKIHGEEGARLAAESHTAAIDSIEAIARDEGIDCDFLRLDGYLFLAPGQSPDLLEQERKAARRAGLTDVEFVTSARFPRSTPAGASVFRNRGNSTRSNTSPVSIRRSGSWRRDPYPNPCLEDRGREQGRVETDAGPVVNAGAVVVATNTPINDLVAIHTKQAPYLTYAIGALVPRGSVHRPSTGTRSIRITTSAFSRWDGAATC